jgi:two-component system, NarL family, nitrate/nitrite response regulator NarL
VKLLVIDDHSVVREGLAAMLRTFGPDTVVIGAEDGPKAFEIIARESGIDVVILDLTLSGMDGMKVLETMGTRWPGLPVMVLSASEDPSNVRRAMAMGALGYVPKSASPETLIAAIKLVLSGELYVPPFMLAADGQPKPGRLPRLTDRQNQVLAALCRGLSNKAIARDLSMSEKTVKAHITAIFRLLGVSNRMQAVNMARQMGNTQGGPVA